MKRNRGFTLVELMITLIVMGVVIFIAVPNFADLIRSNRMTTSSNELVIAMQIARSEAVKRGENVEVCARASDGSQSCSGDADTWPDGWLVWHDADDDSTLDSGEVIRAWSPLAEDLDINVGSAAIAFDNQGFSMGSGTVSYVLQPDGCPSGEERVTVSVGSTGRPDSTRSTCP